ncbi:MAG TPA: hypothetical protein PLQ36_00070 [Candidatus Gracilibacteria bacterium]|nr:hypothetical protein [Candidatus Gracilibacteria bacterium]
MPIETINKTVGDLSDLKPVSKIAEDKFSDEFAESSLDAKQEIRNLEELEANFLQTVVEDVKHSILDAYNYTNNLTEAIKIAEGALEKRYMQNPSEPLLKTPGQFQMQEHNFSTRAEYLDWWIEANDFTNKLREIFQAQEINHDLTQKLADIYLDLIKDQDLDVNLNYPDGRGQKILAEDDKTLKVHFGESRAYVAFKYGIYLITSATVFSFDVAAYQVFLDQYPNLPHTLMETPFYAWKEIFTGRIPGEVLALASIVPVVLLAGQLKIQGQINQKANTYRTNKEVLRDGIFPQKNIMDIIRRGGLIGVIMIATWFSIVLNTAGGVSISKGGKLSQKAAYEAYFGEQNSQSENLEKVDLDLDFVKNTIQSFSSVFFVIGGKVEEDASLPTRAEIENQKQGGPKFSLKSAKENETKAGDAFERNFWDKYQKETEKEYKSKRRPIDFASHHFEKQNFLRENGIPGFAENQDFVCLGDKEIMKIWQKKGINNPQELMKAFDILGEMMSGNSYEVLGPRLGKASNRAIGRFQIMPEAWKSYSQMYFGRIVSPSPANQDAMAAHLLGDWYQKLGNLDNAEKVQRIAQAWNKGESFLFKDLDSLKKSESEVMENGIWESFQALSKNHERFGAEIDSRVQNLFQQVYEEIIGLGASKSYGYYEESERLMRLLKSQLGLSLETSDEELVKLIVKNPQKQKEYLEEFQKAKRAMNNPSFENLDYAPENDKKGILELVNTFKKNSAEKIQGLKADLDIWETVITGEKLLNPYELKELHDRIDFKMNLLSESLVILQKEFDETFADTYEEFAYLNKDIARKFKNNQFKAEKYPELPVLKPYQNNLQNPTLSWSESLNATKEDLQKYKSEGIKTKDIQKAQRLAWTLFGIDFLAPVLVTLLYFWRRKTAGIWNRLKRKGEVLDGKNPNLAENESRKKHLQKNKDWEKLHLSEIDNYLNQSDNSVNNGKISEIKKGFQDLQEYYQSELANYQSILVEMKTDLDNFYYKKYLASLLEQEFYADNGEILSKNSNFNIRHYNNLTELEYDADLNLQANDIIILDDWWSGDYGLKINDDTFSFHRIGKQVEKNPQINLPFKLSSPANYPNAKLLLSISGAALVQLNDDNLVLNPSLIWSVQK